MRKFAVFFFVLASLLGFGQNSSDPCDALSKAFYNRTDVRNSGNYVSDVKTWLITNWNTISSSSNGMNIGVQIPLPSGETLPVGIGANGTNQGQVQSAVNSGNSYFFNMGWANYVVSQVVNQGTLDAYVKCRGFNNAGLVVMTDNQYSDFFVLDLKWNPIGNLNDIKIHYPDFVNCKLIVKRDSLLIKDGTKIGAGWVRLTCQIIDPNKPAIITVNSYDNGGGQFIMINHKSTLEELYNKCSNGDNNSCTTLEQEVADSCSPNYTVWCNRKIDCIRRYLESKIQYIQDKAKMKEHHGLTPIQLQMMKQQATTDSLRLVISAQDFDLIFHSTPTPDMFIRPVNNTF